MRIGLGSAPLLCWLSAVGMAPAHADSAVVDRLELIKVRDAGKQLDREVRAALVEQLLTVAPAERVDAVQRTHPELATCVVADCFKRLATVVGARWIFHIKIGFDGSDYDLQLVLVDGKSDRIIAPLKERCVLCTWHELTTHVATLARAAAILTRHPEPPPETAHPQPILQPVSPRVTFVSVSKWIAGALAVGLIATGATMLAYDGQASGFKNGTPCDPPAGTICPMTYDTALEGGLILAAGGLMAASAVTLFILDWKRAPRPGIQPGNGGATVTLSGTF